VQWLPAVALVLWLALHYLVLDLIFRLLKITISRIWVVVLSGVIIFCTIRGFDNYTQIIFWQTGIIAYLSNCIVFLLILLYFLKRFFFSGRQVERWEYGVMFLVFFLMGGISETWIIMQAALFALGILATLLFGKKLPQAGLLNMLLAGFFASLLSFVVIFLAPGNSNHSYTMDELSALKVVRSLFVSFADVPRFLIEWVNKRTILCLLIVIASFLCGLQCQTEDGERKGTYLQFGGMAFLAAYLLLWMGFFPGYAVFGVRPPDRALFTAMFIFLMAFSLLCFLIGRAAGSYLPTHGRNLISAVLALSLAFLLYLSPLRTGISQIKLIPVYRLYAQLWDERDAFLRKSSQQGRLNVTIPSIRYHPGLSPIKSTIWLDGDLEENPTNWKNNSVSLYYRLSSITGVMNPPSYEFK
jgi:hypothetical protein